MPKVVDWPQATLAVRGTAMVGVDIQGLTTFWSPGAEELFGWTATETVGRPPPIVPSALLQEWQLKMQRVFETGAALPAAETQRITRDGRSIWVVHSPSPVHGDSGEVIGLVDTLMDVTALKELDDESRALLQVRERELIAMDLHDGLVQALYATVLNLAAHEQSLSDADARRVLETAREDVQRAVEETRGYLVNLREQEFVPRNLEAGLRLLLDALRLNSRVDTELTIDPSVERQLPAETRRHMLYLVREAASNVLRHAHARHVSIEITRSGDCLLVGVSDDGRGFDMERVSPSRRDKHGLGNMAERARLIGGKLTVTSRAGSGTHVHLELPGV